MASHCIRSALSLAAILAPIPVHAADVAVPYVWQNVVVGGGGFAPGVVFSPAERGLAYLRTDMGGAYRWDQRQRRWLPLQDDQAESSFMGVESVAPDPVDANIVYLAAGMGARQPAAILRSRDRGAHWTTIAVPFAMGGNEDGRGLGERLAVDPHAPATLFFGSRHNGLWRSADRGDTWRKVAGFPLGGLGKPDRPRTTHGGLSFVVFDARQRGRVFVGSADPGARHLFRSDDSGATWQAVPGGPTPDLLPTKAVVGRDGVLTVAYANGIGPNGITRGAVWRFDPATGKARDVTPEPGNPGGYFGITVSAQDPRVIAVSTVNRYRPGDTVWRSADAGAHWSALATRSVRDVSGSPFLDLDGKADFGHWIAGLAIDPFDARHAAYTTGATVYATQDFDARATMHWAPWTKGVEQTAIITFVSPTGGAPLVSGFGDIGGFRHDDLSVSPPHVHTNPYLTNTNTLDYAGLAPAVLVRSGNTHKPVVPDTSLAWSADGGGTWSPLRVPADAADGPETTGNAAITVSADGARFLVETVQPRITADRGKSWTVVRGLPGRLRVTADKADARRFYAIDGGRMLRSDDGGASFGAIPAQGLPAEATTRAGNREMPRALLATPGRAGMLWLLVGQDLYRSTDAGEHWMRASRDVAIARYGLGKGAPGAPFPALYATARPDRGTAVLRSIDGGATWRRIDDAAHRWGSRLRVVTGDPRRFGRVYIGTDGRGIVYGDPQGRTP